jgi:hypothetical protein
MLVELCIANYAKSNGLVNGANDIFKGSTTYCEKIIIWIMFQNFKIETLTKEKYNHHYDNNIESNWKLIELIIKDIRVSKSKSFIITRIQFVIQLAIIRTIHHSEGLSLGKKKLIPLMLKNMGLTYITLSCI